MGLHSNATTLSTTVVSFVGFIHLQKYMEKKDQLTVEIV